MPFYESVFIARQDISASQVDALADDFTKIIESQGGKVAKRENWGLRTLAYRIKKNRKGYYVLLGLEAPAAAIQEMERQMRLNEDILRHLTLKVEELEAGPSAMMRSRSQRDDRPHRGGRGEGPGGRGPREAPPAREKSAEPPAREKSAEPPAREKPAEPPAPAEAKGPEESQGDDS